MENHGEQHSMEINGIQSLNDVDILLSGIETQEFASGGTVEFEITDDFDIIAR